MANVYIYALSDDIGIKYIGKAKNPKSRLNQHLRDSRLKKYKNYWFDKSVWIRSVNEKIFQTIIEECDESVWKEREIYWIEHYRQTCNLVNQREGGQGVEHGKKMPKPPWNKGLKGTFKHTEETKLRMSVERKGKPQNNKKGQIPWNKGKIWPTEELDRFKNHTHVAWNKGMKNQYTTARKGQTHTEETKEIIRQFSLNMSDEQRAKMSISAKNKIVSEETKAKMSITMKANPTITAPVIDIETGILFNTIIEAYESYPSINMRWKYGTLHAMLKNKIKNKTTLRYA